MTEVIFTKDEIEGVSDAELLAKLEQNGIDLRVGYSEEKISDNEVKFSQDPDSLPKSDEDDTTVNSPEIVAPEKGAAGKADKKAGAKPSAEEEVSKRVAAKKEKSDIVPIDKTMGEYYLKEKKISGGRTLVLHSKFNNAPKFCRESAPGQPKECGLFCACFNATGKTVELCSGQVYDLVTK